MGTDQFNTFADDDKTQCENTPWDGEFHDDPDWLKTKRLIYSRGKFFLASKYLPLITSDRNARMLDFLAGWQRTYASRSEWFYCTTTSIAVHAMIPPRTQSRIFTDLTRDGLIQRKWVDGRRYVRIEYDSIRQRINSEYGDYLRRYNLPIPRPIQNKGEGPDEGC
jgi:hypothetical protein